MTLAFRHRPVPPSPLARWDARWKLAAVLLTVCGIAALDHLAAAAAALALGLFLLVVARLPGSWVRGRLLLFALAALPFLLVLPFTLDGDTRSRSPLCESTVGEARPANWEVGPVHIS